MPGDVSEPSSRPARIGSVPLSGAQWAGSTLRAIALWVLAFAGFVAFPDWLVTHAFENLRPSGRDALVLAWIALWFVVLSWLFVRLQRGDDR